MVLKKRLYRAGVRLIDIKNEIPMRKQIVRASSLKRAPVIPGINTMGRKTKRVVIVEPKVEEPISRVWRAMSSGFWVSCLIRFSSTTMLLSTIIPIPIAIPEREMIFIEISVKYMNKKTPAIDTGTDVMEMSGMTGLLKKRNRTSKAADIPKSIAQARFFMDDLISVERSSITSIVRSFLNISLMVSRLFKTLFAALSVPVLPVFFMNIPMASLPLR
ncbi:hypothetical protein ES703_85984 [subsurface metagenome]